MNIVTRSSDACLLILPVTPGPNHLKTSGFKLPTFLQVPPCFKAHIQKARRDDETKTTKLVRLSAKNVIRVVLIQYQKSNIPTIDVKCVEVSYVV